MNGRWGFSYVKVTAVTISCDREKSNQLYFFWVSHNLPQSLKNQLIQLASERSWLSGGVNWDIYVGMCTSK